MARENDREDDRAKLEAMRGRAPYDNDPRPTMCEETRESLRARIKAALLTEFKQALEAAPAESHPLFYRVEVDKIDPISKEMNITVSVNRAGRLAPITISPPVLEEVSHGESIPARPFLL